MKLTYLGDAHDHWKGSVFQYLQEGEILRNFLVDSMATDASPWNTANSKLYAHLLRIEEKRDHCHYGSFIQCATSRRECPPGKRRGRHPSRAPSWHAAGLQRLEACFNKNERQSTETNPFVAPSRAP